MVRANVCDFFCELKVRKNTLAIAIANFGALSPSTAFRAIITTIVIAKASCEDHICDSGCDLNCDSNLGGLRYRFLAICRDLRNVAAI